MLRLEGRLHLRLEAFGADHLVTGSDYPVLQDYEAYKETFAYIERLGYQRPTPTRSCTTTRKRCSAFIISEMLVGTEPGFNARYSPCPLCLCGEFLEADVGRRRAEFGAAETSGGALRIALPIWARMRVDIAPGAGSGSSGRCRGRRSPPSGGRRAHAPVDGLGRIQR